MLHPKTDEHVNPSVEVLHLFGKLSTAETLLTEVQHKVPTYFLVINICNQGKTLSSPCIFMETFLILSPSLTPFLILSPSLTPFLILSPSLTPITL